MKGSRRILPMEVKEMNEGIRNKKGSASRKRLLIEEAAAADEEEE